RRRRLRRGRFARLPRRVEAVGPQRFAGEIDFGGRLRPAGERGESTRVVEALDRGAEREADDREHDRGERTLHGWRPPCSATIARTIASEISSSPLPPAP